MKKRLVCLLVALLVIFAFSGILYARENPFNFEDAPEKEDQILIRIGSGSMDQWTTVAATYKYFANAAAAKTDNAVRFEEFPANQLGSNTDFTQALQMGTLEMAMPGLANATPVVPGFGVFTLPYMFQSIDELHYVIDNAWDYINEEIVIPNGMRVIAWEDMGFRHFYYKSDEPIEEPEDLQGLKMRTPDDDIMVATYKAWGTDPVPMAWDETFPALQQGVIDGGDVPIDDIIKAGLIEPVNRITKVHYLPHLHPLLISEQFFQSLPEDIQDALVEAGKEASVYARWWVEMNNQEMWRRAEEKYGAKINTVKNEEKWAEMAKTVWPKYYEQIGGKEVVDHITGLIEEYRATH